MLEELEMPEQLKVGYYEVELTYDVNDCTLIYWYNLPVPYCSVRGEDENNTVRNTFHENFVFDDMDIVRNSAVSIRELLKNDPIPKDISRLLNKLEEMNMLDWVSSKTMGVQPHIYDQRYDIVKSVVSQLTNILKDYPLSYQKVQYLLTDLGYLKLVYYLED